MRLSRFYLSLIYLFSFLLTYGQQPLSFSYNFPAYHSEVLPYQLDATLITPPKGKNGSASLIGRALPAAISPVKTGEWTSWQGKKIWRCKVKAVGAKGLILYPDQMKIPAGGELWIYNNDRTIVFGPYRSNENPEGGSYALDVVPSDELTVEYDAWNEEAMDFPFHINEVGYIFKNIGKAGRDFGNSDVCEVNVNCPEGGNWQPEKNAVALILLKLGGALYNCTGTLINNVRMDCTPYFLTADHCYQDDQTGTTATTSELNQWKFYFGFEASGCSNPSTGNGLQNKVLTGCTYVSSSNDMGGDNGSDFALLKIKNKPPDSFHVYYAGWDNRNIAADSGVGIHHPNADIKKISTYKTRLFSDAWGSSVANTHWRIEWAQTATGHGVTEEGSSGSAIFNPEHLVIGTLTGGNSYCSSPTENDFYGKMWYHWTSNGSAANRQLKPWLDPDNTGTATLNGMWSPCYPAGITEQQLRTGINLAPNPASSFVKISCAEDFDQIRIFNVIGEQVVEAKSEKTQNAAVDVRELPAGIFVLEVHSSSGFRAVRTFIKERQ
ncbi:MAG: T9SS type A sorting domain-containing protein [Chitinophagales bacterium]